MPPHFLFNVLTMPKGLSGNKCYKIALRFGSALAGLIELNRRRSRATLRIWRLKTGQRWPEDEMQDVTLIS